MIKLYLPRMSHKHHDRMMEVHHWIERQFGKPDYFTNYNLDFGDDTDDWCCYTFHDDTMGFWAGQRFAHLFLTAERWQQIVQDPSYDAKRMLGLLELEL